MNDAIRDVRGGVTALLTISIVWLATAGAVSSSLTHRDHARHLAAWLLIRDELSPLHDELATILEEGTAARIACIPREVPQQSGTDVQVCDAFTIENPWRGSRRDTLVLDRLADAPSTLRVESRARGLPFADYAVSLIRGRLWVAPARYIRTERDAHDVVLRDSLAGPEDWPAIRLRLTAEGWTGRTPDDLQLSDRSVASFIAAGLAASYTILGVPVSPGFYPTAVGCLLGLIAFMLLGPLHVLRSGTQPPVDHPWIMLTVAAGRRGRALAWARAVLTLVVLALPAAVVVNQLRVSPRLNGLERAALYVSIAGPAICCVVLAAVAVQLARLRKAVDAKR